MSEPDTISEKSDEPVGVASAFDKQSLEVPPPQPSSIESVSIKSETVIPANVLTAKSTATDSDFQPLAANWLRMERRNSQISTWVVGGLLGLGWLVTGLAIRQSFDVSQWLFLIPIGIVVAILIWAASFFPRRSFLATSWRLHPHGFEIRRGIWWRHRIFIPRDRIQHTDVHQGPIQRAYGLASLVLNTGGTHEPSITLEGIDMPVAESLREQLSKHDSIQAQAAAKADAVA